MDFFAKKKGAPTTEEPKTKTVLLRIRPEERKALNLYKVNHDLGTYSATIDHLLQKVEKYERETQSES